MQETDRAGQHVAWTSHRLALSMLSLQMLAVGLALFVTGRFHAELTDDSPGYIEFPFHSLDSALRDIRTPGYPVFLRLVTLVTGSYDSAPAAQYLSFCIAVLVFYFGISQQVVHKWKAALIAGSLLTTNILWLYVQTITTDTLGAAAGITAMGFVLQSYGHGESSRCKPIGIIAATTAAWYIRPAYLFLVLVVPIVSTLMHLKHAPSDQLTYRRIGRHGLRSFAFVCIPLVCWCLLRLCIVQSFGVVSFGGYNLVGIVGQFLDGEQVARLPSDLHPLARLAVEHRERLPANSLQMVELDQLNYLRIENNYDVTIWKIFTPAAQELYGNDASQVNTQLRRLATATLQLGPRKYAVWLAKAFRHGIYKLISDITLNPFGLVVIVVAGCIGILRLARTWRNRSILAASTTAPVIESLFVLTFCYAALNLLETILVCPPLGRMTDAAAVLLIPLLTAVMLRQFEFTPSSIAAAQTER